MGSFICNDRDFYWRDHFIDSYFMDCKMNNNEPITFDLLCRTLDDVTIIKDGTEAYARCPWCGKPPYDDRGRLARHFHFGRLNGHEYGKCFPCGESGGYVSVYRQATGEHVNYAPRRQQQEPKRSEPEITPLWKEYAQELLASYQKRNDSYELWNTYKPVEMPTIREYNLGVGVLPYTLTHKPSGCKYDVLTFAPDGRDPEVVIRSQKTGVERRGYDYLMSKTLYEICGTYEPVQHTERLIVPLFDEHGEIVGLRGRSMDPEEKRYKWMSVSGGQTPIFGVEYVNAGDTVVLCENFVDAAMVAQMGSTWRGVALSTARTIKPDEVERLKARQPGTVIVMLDNDLAGQATGGTRKRLEEEYESKHGRKAPTPLYGYKCMEALCNARVPSVLFVWEQYDAPAKAGVDWALEQVVIKESV